MSDSRAFLAGLLDDADPVAVAAQDFAGPHGPALRAWQTLGLIAGEPCPHPCAGCPRCDDGVPVPVAHGRHLCSACWDPIPEANLQLWLVRYDALLGWLAEAWALSGTPRRVEANLWRLGEHRTDTGSREVFFRRRGALTGSGRLLLKSRRQAIIVFGVSRPPEPEVPGQRLLSLADALPACDSPPILGLDRLLGGPEQVRFDRAAGTLWDGDRLLGEVPVGSREWAFLDCLAGRLDEFVPYVDLKREVLGRTHGQGDADEATFCHGIKRRLKREFIPDLDKYVSTTNKGDGYRLRARCPL